MAASQGWEPGSEDEPPMMRGRRKFLFLCRRPQVWRAAGAASGTASRARSGGSWILVRDSGGTGRWSHEPQVHPSDTLLSPPGVPPPPSSSWQPLWTRAPGWPGSASGHRTHALSSASSSIGGDPNPRLWGNQSGLHTWQVLGTPEARPAGAESTGRARGELPPSVCLQGACWTPPCCSPCRTPPCLHVQGPGDRPAC